MSKQARHLAAGLVGALLCLLPALGPAAASPADPLPEPWLFLPWDTEVGRVRGDESDSEGPKSFALKPDGGVLILDQANLRVIDLDDRGDLVRHVPLPAATFDDVEQLGGETLLVLDRLAARTLLVMDMQGSPLVDVALEGRGIPRAGSVTALLPRSDGVWLEVAHRYSVKVLDHDLEPCTRQIVLGRPMERGFALRGAKDGRGGVTVQRAMRNDRGAAPGITLYGDDPIRRLVWLDEDALGRVYAVLHEAVFADTSPFRVRREAYRLVVMDQTLGLLAQSESPWVLTTYDQRVEVRVGADGLLWQMAFTDDGVLLLRWDWRTP